MPYAIYANIKCLVKKIDSCENNPQISSTRKIGEHSPCGYLLSTIWGFSQIVNKLFLYCGKDYERILQVFKRTCNENNQFQVEKKCCL